MSKTWRDIGASESRLAEIWRAGIISSDHWEKAQQLAGRIPTRNDWVAFGDRLLLLVGTVFLIAGVFFFIAFNWEDLPRWGRFATVQVATVGLAILALILGFDRWTGRMALLATSMLIGATFAIVGQEYQLGADSYGLFLYWTLLITGLVLVSRWNVMWFLWMILINITIASYWWQVIGKDGAILNVILITLNASFVIAWGYIGQTRKIAWMLEGRWLLYILMLIALVHASYLMFDYIFKTSYWFVTLGDLAPLVYCTLMAILLFFYTRIQRDLLMLTLASFSVLIVGITFIGYHLFQTVFQNISDPVFYFCLMGIASVGLTVGLVIGLQRLQSNWGME